MSDEIPARLREAAIQECRRAPDSVGLSPESVQRGLERAQAKFGVLWMSSTKSGIEVWGQIQQAFLEGMRDA